MLDNATQKSYEERFAIVRSLKKEALIPKTDRIGLTVENVGPNAFFEYRGSTYVIQDIARYEETDEQFKSKTGYVVHELTCLCLETGKTVHMEWERDDALEISITLERFSFRSLTDDAGEAVDEDDLDQIADDRDMVMLNGEKFWYEDDWAALYQRGTTTQNVYLYEFANEDQTCFLTIEEWSGSRKAQYQIYTSKPVPAGEIDLITKGE